MCRHGASNHIELFSVCFYACVCMCVLVREIVIAFVSSLCFPTLSEPWMPEKKALSELGLLPDGNVVFKYRRTLTAGGSACMVFCSVFRGSRVLCCCLVRVFGLRYVFGL